MVHRNYRRDLSRVIAETPVGSRIKIVVLREGEKKTFRVKIAKRADSEAVAKAEIETNDGLGLQLEVLTPELAERLGLNKDERGVIRWKT